MKYIVYQTVNKTNGKLYIGVHKTENPDIFDGYIGNGVKVGWSLENPKTAFQYALKKYGYDSFIRTTLFVFDTETEAYDKEQEIVNMAFVRNKNNYNIKTGGSGGGCFKSVYQFSYDGKLIKKWDSVISITENFSCNSNRINMACSNKYSAFSSYWSFFNKIDLSEYRKSKNSELYQFSHNGELISIFENTSAAAISLGLNINTLNEAVSKKKQHIECYWTKNQDDIMNIIKVNDLNNMSNKRVHMYDASGIFAESFLNVKNAADVLDIKYGTIKSAITKKNMVGSKAFFSYEKQENFSLCGSDTKLKQVAQYSFDTGELVKTWDSITECAKYHPKCRDVIKGGRNHTHGYTFKYVIDETDDIV